PRPGDRDFDPAGGHRRRSLWRRWQHLPGGAAPGAVLDRERGRRLCGDREPVAFLRADDAGAQATPEAARRARPLTPPPPSPSSMPKIVAEHSFDGAAERIVRLGLAPLRQELEAILTGFELRVEERRDANGAAEIRKRFDDRFQ